MSKYAIAQMKVSTLHSLLRKVCGELEAEGSLANTEDVLAEVKVRYPKQYELTR